MRQSINFLPLFVIIFFIACKTNNRADTLTGKNHKFWDVSTEHGYCYEFSKSDVCRYFAYMNHNGKSTRELFDFGDVVYPNTWEFINDTTINIQGFKYFYKIINADSVKLVNVKNPNDHFFLISSPNQ